MIMTRIERISGMISHFIVRFSGMLDKKAIEHCKYFSGFSKSEKPDVVDVYVRKLC
jgi:hypothetical protein